MTDSFDGPLPISSVYVQEVLVTTVLLSRCSWSQRAGLLFNVFKCIGTEEMSHDDFILAAHAVVVSLCRLWGSARWESSSLADLSEALADNAFTKVHQKNFIHLITCNIPK